MDRISERSAHQADLSSVLPSLCFKSIDVIERMKVIIGLMMSLCVCVSFGIWTKQMLFSMLFSILSSHFVFEDNGCIFIFHIHIFHRQLVTVHDVIIHL